MTTFVEFIYFSNLNVKIIKRGDVKAMKVDIMLNELLKKVEYSGLWIETINLKELDKKSTNRL